MGSWPLKAYTNRHKHVHEYAWSGNPMSHFWITKTKITYRINQRGGTVKVQPSLTKSLTYHRKYHKYLYTYLSKTTLFVRKTSNIWSCVNAALKSLHFSFQLSVNVMQVNAGMTKGILTIFITLISSVSCIYFLSSTHLSSTHREGNNQAKILWFKSSSIYFRENYSLVFVGIWFLKAITVFCHVGCTHKALTSHKVLKL